MAFGLSAATAAVSRRRQPSVRFIFYFLFFSFLFSFFGNGRLCRPLRYFTHIVSENVGKFLLLAETFFEKGVAISKKL